MNDFSGGYRARLYLPSSAPCFNSVISLGDAKVIRARLAYLIKLGFEYEQMQLGKNIDTELEVTAPDVIIKTKKVSSPKTEVSKDKANHEKVVVQDEHLKQLPYKVPDNFSDQTFSFS